MKHEFNVKKYKDATVYTLESASGGATGSGSVASVSMPMGGVRRRGDNLIAQEEKKEAPKPRNFVAKNAKMGGAGQHKDKKKAEKQGDVKHKNKQMDVAEGFLDLFKKKKRDPANFEEYMVYDTFTIFYDPTDETFIVKGRGEWEDKLPTKEFAANSAMGGLSTAQSYGEYRTGGIKEPIKINRGVINRGAHEGMAQEDHEISMASNELKSIHSDAQKLLSLVQRYGQNGDLEAWQQSKITKAADYLNSVLQSIGGEQDASEAYGRHDRRDAYQRDYDHSVAGMDRGNNHRDDERHDLDPSDWYIVRDGKMYKTSVYPRQEQEAISRGYSRTRDEAKAKADDQGVAEGGGLDNYRQRVNSQGFTDSPEEREADRSERKRRHQDALNRISDIGGGSSDEERAHQAQQRMARDEYKLDRLKRNDDDWENTFDMMRDRMNRYQWSSQRDVDPEQLAAISNIKYEPKQKNETVQAKTDDKLLAYYAQRKAEKEKQKQQGVAEGGGDPQITPGMKTQYGTVVKVNGNTVIVKEPNGDMTTVNIHDIQQADAYTESLMQKLSEKIPKNAPVDVWIQDFEKSTAPQFRGKTKEKRRQMAVAASYAAKNPSKKKNK